MRQPRQFSIRPSRRNASSGAAQIEFVLSFLIVMFVVFWIFELSGAVYTYCVLANAAKEGVRYAIVHGTGNSGCNGPSSGCDSTAAGVVSRVRDYAGYTLHDVSGLQVNVTYLDASSDPPSRVNVQVVYPYIPYFILPWSAPNMVASSQGRIVN